MDAGRSGDGRVEHDETGRGGAIANSVGTLVANNCTIVRNTANTGGGIISGGAPWRCEYWAEELVVRFQKEDLSSTPPVSASTTWSSTIQLGGTTLELSYHGLNHSDSTLVMRLRVIEPWASLVKTCSSLCFTALVIAALLPSRHAAATSDRRPRAAEP